MKTAGQKNIQGKIGGQTTRSAIKKLSGGSSAYAGSFDQPDIPSPLQILDGQWGFWFDTDTSQMFMVRNRLDVMYVVELGSFP
jgi:hypothetical protein